MEAAIDNHDCVWRTKANELTQCVEGLKARIEQLERMVFGKRSEKMPSVKRELKVSADPKKTQERRAERRAARNELPEVRYEHHVKSEDRQCPKRGSCELKKLGEGKLSTLIEYVPAHLERQVHVQESLACPCGEYVVVAEGPQRPVEGGHYGSRFMASVVTAKCADSMPLYRLEKQLKRVGLSVSRSSLCNLFHHTAESLKPIYEYMLDKMPQLAWY